MSIVITGLQNVVEFVFNHPWLLISALVCCVLAFFIKSVFFNGEEKGGNPFEKDFRRPHEPFEHDPKARDAIIKDRYKSSKVPQDLDVIIIGSGIGGLTAGVLLGRAGKKCLVLEQHDQAGGCCHSFVEKGFEFDTGIHYIGVMKDSALDKVLLDQMTCGQLRWARMDDEFDTVVLGPSESVRKYPMKSGRERFTQNLIDMFPEEKEAIKKYMGLVEDCSTSFSDLFIIKMLPKKLVRFLIVTGLYRLLFKCYRKGHIDVTLQEVLDKTTSNMDLQAVLAYAWIDYGVIPRDGTFFFHALLTHYYAEGSCYPMNGSSEIAYYMCQAIREAGGRVLVQAPVAKILCNDSGKAVGVQIAKTDEVIKAPIIVSSAGVINTFKFLLPKELAQKSCIYPVIDNVGPSRSSITTFVGIDGDSNELNLPAGNTWYTGTNDINKNMDDFMNTSVEDLADIRIPFHYISFPSAKDPEWKNKHPGKSSVLLITVAKWEWFQEWKGEKLRHRGDRYEAIKDAIGRNMWQQCVELFPQLDGKMVYMEVGTPISYQHYLGNPEGEMYGLSQGPARFDVDAVSKLRVDTDIPGLYLSGQDVLTSGFGAAMFTGFLCASQVLHRNLFGDVNSLQESMKKKEQLKPVTEKKTD